jgi:hypothetical protein
MARHPWIRLSLAFLCCAVLLGACDYAGKPDNAVERRFTWFSYLAGEDVRQSCRSHAPPRYRFVYNGIFTEYIRTYELNGLPGGDGGMLDGEILSAEVAPGFLAHFPYWPWSGKRSVVQVNGTEMKLLRRALEDSGYDHAPPVGTVLDSHSNYWMVSSCEGNRFHFNAWVHPSPAFDDIRFTEILAGLDGLNSAFPPPRPLTPEEAEYRPRPARAQEAGYFRFFAEVTHDGLRIAARP